MSFLSFLFYSTLLILIKLGDIVYSFYLGMRTFFSFKKDKKEDNIQKQKKRKIQNKKTISLFKFNFFNFFSKFIAKTFQFCLLALRLIVEFIRLLVLIVVIPLKFIILVFFFPFKIIRRVFRKKKKRGRPANPHTITKRMPFLFKLKYLTMGTVIACIFIFLPSLFLIFIADLPKLSNLSVNYISKSTKILDRNGNLLFEIYANQNRTIVALNKIPKDLIQATIAIEDKDFYQHNGFDVRGIVRAIYVDLVKKDFQGGSTITQQLIKSALLTPEPTITRKARELVLAFWAEKKYTKDQILELYFNYIPYGGTAWGVEAASQIYFGKNVSSLTLAQSAYLAGLPQAPSQYSPFAGDGSLGKERQKEVLKAMVSVGYITDKQAKEAYGEKLEFRSPQVPIQAPHFVMYVKDLLIKKYGLFEVERGGLQVSTTLDINMQKMAEGIVSDEVDKSGYLGVGNGAALITNPKNGDILAMVGSRDYFDPDHDGNVNITTSLRQPGSTIKVVTYSLALSKGLTEATILDDSPVSIVSPGAPVYRPVNYDGRFHGRVPIRIALANSYNIPAVRLAQRFGVSEVVDFGKKMGISSWGKAENYGVAITLGSAEVSMVELATVYGTVANEGERITVDPILKIVDSSGKILQEKEIIGERVMDRGAAFIISDILADNRARSSSFGANSPLTIPNYKVSVKTGTTDNKRDNWTIGYTPNLLVATWVGNNDNTPLSQALASGITGAAPMWGRIMTSALEKTDKEQESVPEDIVAKPCFGYTAYFIVGTDTKESCKYSIPTPTFLHQ